MPSVSANPKDPFLSESLSQNLDVIPDPAGNLKFWVYLGRDASLDPHFSVQNALDADFKIHYEVEGPCA